MFEICLVYLLFLECLNSHHHVLVLVMFIDFYVVSVSIINGSS
jgi:hypothetical protein